MTPNEDYVLTVPGAIDKFMTAGQVANDSMKEIIALCVPNKKVVEIIKEGNQLINGKLSKVYTNKKLGKGIAFPVNININSICGYFSPLSDDNTILKEGDLVKIDLGVHVDNYPVMVAHTVEI